MTPLTAREALADVRLLTCACRLARGESLASVAAGIGITANNLAKYCESRGWEVRYRAPRWAIFGIDCGRELKEGDFCPEELRVALLDYKSGRARTACKLARVARKFSGEWRRVPAVRGLYRGDALLIDSLPPGFRVHEGLSVCCDAFDPRCYAVIEFRNSFFCANCAAGILRHEENWP